MGPSGCTQKDVKGKVIQCVFTKPLRKHLLLSLSIGGICTHLLTDLSVRLFFVDKQDDGLLHIGWKDRETHEVVDDFIVFAEDAVFEKVRLKEGWE